MSAASDADVEVVEAAGTEASTGAGGRVFHPLRVAAIEPVAEGALALTFEVPPELAAAYRFRAGQHLTLRTWLDGVELRRTYSLCAPAVGAGARLRVAVKRLPGGAFSTWVHERLRVGEVVDVLTPLGRFGPQLDPARARHYAAIAGGSGITPVLAIAATALRVEPASQVTVVVANRTSAEVMFLDELADLKDQYPTRFHLVHVLSREVQESPLLSGRLDAERLRAVLAGLVDPAGVDEWYLCGPFGLVETAREVLGAAGVAGERVHVELFHVDGAPPVARSDDDALLPAGATLGARLGGRTSTEVVRSGETVLDAVLRVRADAPYACRGGVCGTCRAQLLAGEVRMDSCYALEPAEVAAGFVLACQSRPVTEHLVLDFDA